jgi:hypothetical protein
MSDTNEKKTSPVSDAGNTQQAAAVAPQFVAVDPRVLELLMEDKAEQAALRKQQREHQAKVSQLRREGAADAVKGEVEGIQACCLKGHQKGGKHRKKTAVSDKLISVHQFIGTEWRVRFLCCGLVVWGPRQGGQVPQDTKEIVYRDRGLGFKPEPNPSYNLQKGLPGIGFAEAMLLAQNETSNVLSKSETVFANPAVKANELERENAELKAKLAAMAEQDLVKK